MLLINCDLGEWETLEETEWMMQHIQQANAACGGHAGSAYQLENCRKLADKYQVDLGMHPGVAAAKGRGDVSDLKELEFQLLLEQQYDFFRQHAGAPTHVKLHGSLYHLSESNDRIRAVYIEFAESKKLPILALAGGRVINEYVSQGGVGITEGFLDRNYNNDGTLVSRNEHNAMLSGIEETLVRFEKLSAGEGLYSTSGREIKLEIDSLCVHSDSEFTRVTLGALVD